MAQAKTGLYVRVEGDSRERRVFPVKPDRWHPADTNRCYRYRIRWHGERYTITTQRPLVSGKLQVVDTPVRKYFSPGYRLTMEKVREESADRAATQVPGGVVGVCDGGGITRLGGSVEASDE